MRCLIASHGVTLHRAILRVPSRIPHPYPQDGTRMKLSFLDIKNARPEDKPYRISDGDGLSVQVQPNGHKLWRYRYRFAGVEKLLALGSFPATSLADARAKRDAARAALEKGIDPSVQKKLDKIAAATQARNTFGNRRGVYREPPRASWRTRPRVLCRQSCRHFLAATFAGTSANKSRDDSRLCTRGRVRHGVGDRRGTSLSHQSLATN